MAFPVVESVTQTGFSTADTSHAVDLPATVDAGDLLLMLLSIDNQATPSVTDWTQKYSDIGDILVRGAAFVKVADGTEGGGTVTVTLSASKTMAAQVFRISGWEGTVDGVESALNAPSGSTTDIEHPELTPSWGSDDTLWILGTHVGDDNEDTTAIPTDYTDLVDTASNGGANERVRAASARRSVAATSQDPTGWTVSSAAAYVAATIGVQPGGAGGGSTTVEIDQSDPQSVEVDDTLQLSATVTNPDGSTTWASDDTDVATVDASGLVTAVSPGSALITATNNGVSDSITVNVVVVPTLSETVHHDTYTVASDTDLASHTPETGDGYNLVSGAISAIAATGLAEAQDETGNRYLLKTGVPAGTAHDVVAAFTPPDTPDNSGWGVHACNPSNTTGFQDGYVVFEYNTGDGLFRLRNNFAAGGGSAEDTFVAGVPTDPHEMTIQVRPDAGYVAGLVDGVERCRVTADDGLDLTTTGDWYSLISIPAFSADGGLASAAHLDTLTIEAQPWWSLPAALASGGNARVAVAGGDVVYAAGHEGTDFKVWRSADNGETWDAGTVVAVASGAFPMQYGGIRAEGDTVHVVTAATDPGGENAHLDYWRSTDGAENFDAAVRITGAGEQVRRANIDVAADGTLFVFGGRVDASQNYGGAFIFRSQNDGAAWVTTEVDSAANAAGGSPWGIVDGSIVHFAYARKFDSPSVYHHSYYVRSTDGGDTYSAPLNIGEDVVEQGEARQRVALSGGSLLVSWTANDGSTKNIKGVRSTDDGANWTAPYVFITPPAAEEFGHQEMRAIGDAGRFFMTVSDETTSDHDILHAWSSDGGRTWTVPVMGIEGDPDAQLSTMDAGDGWAHAITVDGDYSRRALSDIPHTITPALIESTAEVFEPTISEGAGAGDTITPGFITSAATVFEPTVAPGGVTVQPAFIASVSQVFEPAVQFGAVAIVVPLIESASEVFAPGIFGGEIDLRPPFTAEWVDPARTASWTNPNRTAEWKTDA